MAEFLQWWHDLVARLDGERERKVVAFGAMALLLFLSVGPTVLNAVAETIAALPEKQAEPVPPAPKMYFASSPETPQPVAEPETEKVVVVADIPPVPQLTLPPLTFLFPNAGAEVFSPATIAMRAESATTVAMLIEVTNAAGERVGTYSASPSTTGEWSALFSAEPGEYVASVRASLEDGRVVSFKEQRAFRVLTPEPTITPADPSEPSVDLLAPDMMSGAYEGIAPLAARVKNAQPNSLIFIVTSSAGDETLVLGSEVGASGYWTAMFEGLDGTYHARVRATIGEREVFSAENEFSLLTADR
ncbi:MAG: hypothetical protein WC866_03200 [Patescibacteria group bacterium]|jgi:hypothetical protein